MLVNVRGQHYDGSNADLTALVQNSVGDIEVTLQFPAPGKNLTQLSAGVGRTYKTPYSGSVTAVPEPSTIFAGTAMLLLGVLTHSQRSVVRIGWCMDPR